MHSIGCLATRVCAHDQRRRLIEIGNQTAFLENGAQTVMVVRRPAPRLFRGRTGVRIICLAVNQARVEAA